jgi:demethylmenaquinone methyltransferase/2-methoxy-6-polyprenyl-1,4-benzoquinol methylase
MSRRTLAGAIATPEGKRRYVRTLFATIADRYDLITRALSYGQDRRWKKRLVRMASPAPGLSVLDLATGTGDIAAACAACGAAVVGLDVTKRMVEIACLKHGARVRFIVGDMQALPFPPASFDIVTTGYGLRNVPDLTTALEEIQRVLKPGGAILSLDFNRPKSRVIRAIYLAYLEMVGGALGFFLHRDPDTYRYIPASIRRYPGADGVAQLMRTLGFSRTHCHPVLGGLMAIHHGIRD